MSTIQIIKCANYDCNNTLSDFELSKLIHIRKNRSRWSYCHECRMHPKLITGIRCVTCGNKMDCGLKMIPTKTYCPPCAHLKRRAGSRERYRLKPKIDKRHPKKTINILQILSDGKAHSVREIMSPTGLAFDTVRGYVSLLRKQNHRIICEFTYRLENKIG